MDLTKLGFLDVAFCVFVLSWGISVFFWGLFKVLLPGKKLREELKGDMGKSVGQDFDIQAEIRSKVQHWENGYLELNNALMKFIAAAETLPYLGMLGTLISLANISGTASVETITENFIFAILSSLVALVFAIACKIQEGFLHGILEMPKRRLGYYSRLLVPLSKD